MNERSAHAARPADLFIVLSWQAAKGMRLCAFLAALLPLGALPAAALPDAARYPPATCAAFLLGREDFARVSPLLPADPGAAAQARRFRDAAIAAGATPAEADAWIARERITMALLFEAMILDDDGPSRDLHDRLAALCARVPD